MRQSHHSFPVGERRLPKSLIGHLRETRSSMIMRSLQPRFARHLMGFPHVDFGSLVQALYGIEEGITRGLWPDSSPSDSKGKKPAIGQRPGDVSTISATRPRSPRYYQTVG